MSETQITGKALMMATGPTIGEVLKERDAHIGHLQRRIAELEAFVLSDANMKCRCEYTDPSFPQCRPCRARALLEKKP